MENSYDRPTNDGGLKKIENGKLMIASYAPMCQKLCIEAKTVDGGRLGWTVDGGRLTVDG